jgi:hypothetical protein
LKLNCCRSAGLRIAHGCRGDSDARRRGHVCRSRVQTCARNRSDRSIASRGSVDAPIHRARIHARYCRCELRRAAEHHRRALWFDHYRHVRRWFERGSSRESASRRVQQREGGEHECRVPPRPPFCRFRVLLTHSEMFRKNCSIAVQARPDACGAPLQSVQMIEITGEERSWFRFKVEIRNSEPPSAPRFLSHNGTAGQVIQFQYGTRNRPNALNSPGRVLVMRPISSTRHSSLFFGLIESLWGIKTSRNSLKTKDGGRF